VTVFGICWVCLAVALSTVNDRMNVEGRWEAIVRRLESCVGMG
jgi:hypothetical protein